MMNGIGNQQTALTKRRDLRLSRVVRCKTRAHSGHDPAKEQQTPCIGYSAGCRGTGGKKTPPQRSKREATEAAQAVKKGGKTQINELRPLPLSELSPLSRLLAQRWCDGLPRTSNRKDTVASVLQKRDSKHARTFQKEGRRCFRLKECETRADRTCT